VAAGASLVAALAVGSVPLPLRELVGAALGSTSAGADIVLGLRAAARVVGVRSGRDASPVRCLAAGAPAQPAGRSLRARHFRWCRGGRPGCAGARARVVAVQASAIVGALLTLAILFVLARRSLYSTDMSGGEQAAGSVLLTGVMLASFAAALMSLVLALAPDGRLRPMMFWLLGDLSGATDPWPAVLALVLAIVLLLFALDHARSLNLMLRGDLQAYTQGVRVAATRRRLVLVAAIATASAVTLGGPWALSASSLRISCACGSATISASCCRPRCFSAARSSSWPTRSHERPSRRCNCRSGC